MESLIPPFDAYKGAEPYIFISYAHKNSDVVFPHITRLHNEGFRIWYDEGIDPGADWSDEIAQALVNAAVFLVFISDASVNSHNVRKEIVFAIDQRKYMVCVFVEETQLPSGLKMQLGNIQALLEPRFPDKEKFYKRLFGALLPEQTCGTERDSLPIWEVPSKSKHNTEALQQKKKKKTVFSVIGAAVLCAVMLGGFWFFQKSGDGPALPGGTPVPATRQELPEQYGAVTAPDKATYPSDRPVDFEAYIERYQKIGTTPEGAVKMYFDALYSYIDPARKIEGGKMLGYSLRDQKGWEGNPSRSIFKSRLDAPSTQYIFRSFAAGTSPENRYSMSADNYQLLFVNKRQVGDYTTVSIRSTGADSPRSLHVKQFEDGLWYVINNNGTYADVRKPAN